MRTMVGGTVVTQLRPEVGNQIDIRVIATDATRRESGSLGAIPLVSATATTVRLGPGGARSCRTPARPGSSAPTGSAWSRSPASVAGRSLGDVARDVRAVTDAMPLPEGYG